MQINIFNCIIFRKLNWSNIPPFFHPFSKLHGMPPKFKLRYNFLIFSEDPWCNFFALTKPHFVPAPGTSRHFARRTLLKPDSFLTGISISFPLQQDEFNFLSFRFSNGEVESFVTKKELEELLLQKYYFENYSRHLVKPSAAYKMLNHLIWFHQNITVTLAWQRWRYFK